MNTNTCQFPMWGMKLTHIYCTEVAKGNSPYCTKHHKLCYEKPRYPIKLPTEAKVVKQHKRSYETFTPTMEAY